MDIEALIFDLDGVLVNTVDLHFQAWAYLAAQRNVSFDSLDMHRLRGRQRRDCLLELFDGHNLTEAEIAVYLEIKDHYYLDLINQTAPEDLLAPHAVQLIDAARECQLKVGVASSSANAIAILKYIGLDARLDVIADGNTVARSKPAPDIFVWTAGALGVSPMRCIAFEDSYAGITAARRGGMFTVGVGSQESMEPAHLVISDFGAVQLAEILYAARQRLMQQPQFASQ
jgi:beta-phosphoglucomutase